MTDATRQLKTLDAANRERWDNFVRGAGRGTFFHLAGWKQVLSQAFGHRCHYLYVERLYPLYAHSLRDLGTPVFAKKYMRLLKTVFGDACEIMIVTQQGREVAGVLSFYFRDEVLPYYAGANEHARDLKANDFMYWQLMCRAAERGVRVFDFGRSKRETGAFDFKRHWGFDPQPLYYEYDLVKADQLPNLSPTNPRYQRFIKAWQKMPIPLTRVVGPMLARNLG